MLAAKEIQKRFGTPRRVPFTPLEEKARETVATVLKGTAIAVNDICPDGRELACVITHLEEALFWALAAIERNPERL